MKEQENEEPRNDARQAQDNQDSDQAYGDDNEAQRLQDASIAAEPAYELHTEDQRRLKENERGEETDSSEQADGSEQEGAERPEPLNPAEENASREIGEDWGGSTNLTLEQLKKEGGIANPDDDQ